MTTPKLKLVSSRGSSPPRALPLRRALVCAGGGVTGAIYETGVLAALEERLDGFPIQADLIVGTQGSSAPKNAEENREDRGL